MLCRKLSAAKENRIFLPYSAAEEESILFSHVKKGDSVQKLFCNLQHAGSNALLSRKEKTDEQEKQTTLAVDVAKCLSSRDGAFLSKILSNIFFKMLADIFRCFNCASPLTWMVVIGAAALWIGLRRLSQRWEGLPPGLNRKPRVDMYILYT